MIKNTNSLGKEQSAFREKGKNNCKVEKEEAEHEQKMELIARHHYKNLCLEEETHNSNYAKYREREILLETSRILKAISRKIGEILEEAKNEGGKNTNE